MKNLLRAAVLLAAAFFFIQSSTYAQVSIQVRNSSGTVLGTFASGLVTLKCDTTMTCTVSGTTVLMTPSGGSSGGNTITINSTAAASSIVNFNGTTPAAPSGDVLIGWQHDSGSPDNWSAFLVPFGASGSSHKPGAVPDPGSTAGQNLFLREDSTFASAYQLVEVSGSGLNKRAAINLIAGTGVGISCVDNSGANSTDCTVSSSVSSFYQTVQAAGSSQTQRAKLNFLSPIIVADNSGNGSTDISLPTFAGIHGTPTSGNCTAWFDATHVQDAGSPCGSGGGGSGGAGGIVVGAFNSLTLTTTTFLSLGGGLSSTTEANVQVPATATSPVSGFSVNLSVAPGSGNSIAFTLRRNGVDTTETCTASNTATTCTDTTHSFTPTIGDLLDVKAIPSGTPGATNILHAMNYGAGNVAINGDTPPASPNAMDDEFTEATLPVKWTTRNSASVSLSQGSAILSETGSGTNNHVIFTQTIPSAPYRIATKCNNLLVSSSVVSVWGLYLFDSGSGKLIHFGMAFNSGFSVDVEQFNSFSSFQSTPFTATLSSLPLPVYPQYFAIHDDGTNRNYEISNDGINWLSIFSQTNTTFITPTDIGLGQNVITSSITGIFASDWFRRVL